MSIPEVRSSAWRTQEKFALNRSNRFNWGKLIKSFNLFYCALPHWYVRRRRRRRCYQPNNLRNHFYFFFFTAYGLRLLFVGVSFVLSSSACVRSFVRCKCARCGGFRLSLLAILCRDMDVVAAAKAATWKCCPCCCYLLFLFVRFCLPVTLAVCRRRVVQVNSKRASKHNERTSERANAPTHKKTDERTNERTIKAHKFLSVRYLPFYTVVRFNLNALLSFIDASWIRMLQQRVLLVCSFINLILACMSGRNNCNYLALTAHDDYVSVGFLCNHVVSLFTGSSCCCCVLSCYIAQWNRWGKYNIIF